MGLLGSVIYGMLAVWIVYPVNTEGGNTSVLAWSEGEVFSSNEGVIQWDPKHCQD
jgi:hypothetical protein